MAMDENPYRSPQADDLTTPVVPAERPSRNKGTVVIAAACFFVAAIAISIGLGLISVSKSDPRNFIIFGILTYFAIMFGVMGFGLLAGRNRVVVGGLCAIAFIICLPVVIALARR